jgi:hypothetical protein
MRLTEGGDHTAGSSLSGAAGGTPPEGAKRPGFRSSNADSNSIFRGSNTNSEDRVALRSRLRKSCAGDGSRNNDTGGGAAGPAAGRRGSAVGSVRRKSALGAVMEAAGEGAVDSQEQVGAAFEQPASPHVDVGERQSVAGSLNGRGGDGNASR